MDKQKPSVDIPFNIFTATDRFNNRQRRAALDRVCLSMLRTVKRPALIEFFSSHIKEIMAMIEAKDTKVGENLKIF